MVVAIGTNEVFYPRVPEDIATRYEQLLVNLRTNNTDAYVILVSPPWLSFAETAPITEGGISMEEIRSIIETVALDFIATQVFKTRQLIDLIFKGKFKS